MLHRMLDAVLAADAAQTEAEIAQQRQALLEGLRRASAQDAQAACLHDAALDVLAESEVGAKLAALHGLQQAVLGAALHVNGEQGVRDGPDWPGRPQRPPLVSPRDLPQRRLGSSEGRAVLLHAVAHIEFNAINLALDAVQRYAGLPLAYYADWLSVAIDEARHFRLLAERLQELGHAYGDFPAHDGLWQMARLSAADPLTRMALVPRLLEARGLDVTPGMMARLRHAGDERSAAVLALILREEVRHVAIGDHWYRHFCTSGGVEPEARFRELLARHAPGVVRPPFNHVARTAAGFSPAELQALARIFQEGTSRG